MEAATAPETVNERIGARVRALRGRERLSLEALAAASGVSRSALSLIERAESSPTAAVLDRVASALGVPLASLFDGAETTPASPLARRRDQQVWRDPGSGYERRSVSPAGVPSPFRITEVTLPAGARVAFETGQGDLIVHQQLWVLEGTVEFRLGEEDHVLGTGDSLALTLDRPTLFHNPGRAPARYAVVVTTEPGGRR